MGRHKRVRRWVMTDRTAHFPLQLVFTLLATSQSHNKNKRDSKVTIGHKEKYTIGHYYVYGSVAAHLAFMYMLFP